MPKILQENMYIWRNNSNFTSRGMPLYSVGSSTPMPFPLGYRKQLGRSSMAAAVATMWQSSASSEGAITTMLGRHAIKVTSKEPECVGPSDPTNPALSIANLTGSFCKSTSCTTCDMDMEFIFHTLSTSFNFQS